MKDQPQRGDENVIPLNRHNLLEFDDGPSLDASSDYLIKGLIGPGDIGVIYGPSGAGKTFLALYLSYQIAHGRPVTGIRVRRAPVLYVGLEGGRKLQQRIRAATQQYGSPGQNFARMTGSVSLAKSRDGKRGADTIVTAASQLATRAGAEVGLIFIDTLARAIAPDNEDSNQDMAAFANRCDDIARRTGAAIVCIHHPGKDHAKGPRGGSALFAAADMVLRVDSDRTVHIAKNRDGSDGPLLSFELPEVRLGQDADGDPITSCIVNIGEAATPSRKVQKLPLKATLALEVLNELYQRADLLQTVAPESIGLTGIDPTRHVLTVPYDEWRKACAAKPLSDGTSTSAPRQAFERARDRLRASDNIWHGNGHVWLIGKATDAPDGSR